MSEFDKAFADAALYGKGVMRGGKHIPLEDIYMKPTGKPTKAEALQACEHTLKDLDMLRTGEWVPDRHSISATEDNVLLIREFIQRHSMIAAGEEEV